MRSNRDCVIEGNAIIKTETSNTQLRIRNTPTHAEGNKEKRLNKEIHVKEREGEEKT